MKIPVLWQVMDDLGYLLSCCLLLWQAVFPDFVNFAFDFKYVSMSKLQIIITNSVYNRLKHAQSRAFGSLQCPAKLCKLAHTHLKILTKTEVRNHTEIKLDSMLGET